MLVRKNLYAELRLQPTASASEIRTAYRRIALIAHPDKGGSTTAFHSIAFAFEVLSCPASRALYDQAHGKWLKNTPFCRRNASVSRAKPKTTTAQRGFTSGSKRKREAAAASPPAKRRVATPNLEENEGLEEPPDEAGGESDGDPDVPPEHHATHATFEQLRTTLHDLAPMHRRSAIAQMPLQVRTELLAYMSCHHASAPISAPAATDGHKNVDNETNQGSPWSRGTDVRTMRHIHKTSYHAQLRIQHLRMYTRSEADFDTAISHQMALIRARHAIEAAGEEIWNHPREFHNVFMSALESSGLSPIVLGLSVFIFMRADEWISRCATITSPVMPLEDAVAAHTRLLVARQSSWVTLRTEWVLLMRQTQHARHQQLSQAQAEAVAEKARRGLLHQRLKQMISAAERAIGLRCRFEKKAMKVEAQKQRRAAKHKVAEAASQKRLARKRRELWAARRRWYCRSDLSMEAVLQGPPQYSGCP